jgi:transposase
MGNTQEGDSEKHEEEAGKELHNKFVVLPKRGIIERTNAWISLYRRLAKDFGRFGRTVRNWIFFAMTRLMLKRLMKVYA